MQLYPHWLDGEFVKIASEATGPEQDVRDMIRALKLHALLGTQFVLNDVQVFDSAAILTLFGDPDARAFLDRDTTFLDLRVDPDPQLGSSPFALAARGLTRTRTPGWLSSVFITDPTPIKRLADEIIDDVQLQDYVDPARPSRTVQAHPKYAKWLHAVRHAVRYFGALDRPQRLVATRGERTNYYQVLCDLADKQDVLEEDRRAVAEALGFINCAIEDPDARKARSRVRAILDRIDEPTKRDRIWNNVVQAWNYATQQTLRPDGGSVGTLPGALSPAPYFESVTDILVRVDAHDPRGPMDAVPAPAVLPCEIDEISWSQIAQVRADTASTMEELTRARYSGSIEVVSEPLRRHLNVVAGILRPPQKVSTTAYVLKIGATVVGVLGSVSVVPLAVAAGGLGVADILHSAWRDSEPWRQRRALANTLSRAARGQSK